MGKTERPLNWLCWILGHKANFTGKYRDYCPNVGLYICGRCGRASMVYPPTLSTAIRMRWRELSDYRYETYVT